MKTSVSILLLAILAFPPFPSHADEKAAAPPAAPVAAQPAVAQQAPATPGVKYNLRNLKPVGLSEQYQGARNRELLQFTNEQGKQNILYEEATTLPTLKEINRLAPFMASSVHTCSIDLECKTKAFCTDNCRSLFYEVTNNPTDPSLAEKSNCVLRAFTCLTEGQASRAVANTAAQPGAAATAPAPPKGP
jgi:hypothetical protein